MRRVRTRTRPGSAGVLAGGAMCGRRDASEALGAVQRMQLLSLPGGVLATAPLRAAAAILLRAEALCHLDTKLRGILPAAENLGRRRPSGPQPLGCREQLPELHALVPEVAACEAPVGTEGMPGQATAVLPLLREARAIPAKGNTCGHVPYRHEAPAGQRGPCAGVRLPRHLQGFAQRRGETSGVVVGAYSDGEVKGGPHTLPTRLTVDLHVNPWPRRVLALATGHRACLVAFRYRRAELRHALEASLSILSHELALSEGSSTAALSWCAHPTQWSALAHEKRRGEAPDLRECGENEHSCGRARPLHWPSFLRPAAATAAPLPRHLQRSPRNCGKGVRQSAPRQWHGRSGERRGARLSAGH
mmetsp:Transcript_10939/g.24563  ORF Transcript_10939/g.24563 Transcript_10939/m.24563 type:complete len:361 (-) Transcript_10939:24-1106(-)